MKRNRRQQPPAQTGPESRLPQLFTPARQEPSPFFGRTSLATLALVNAIMLASHGNLEAQTAASPAATPVPSTSSETTVMSEVVVTAQENAYKRDAVSLTKYSEPLVDTPQSITVVPRQVMDDQNSTTLRDALRNVSGISIAAGEGGAQGDNLTIRGFTARSDFFLDGMRDFGSYARDPFNLEAVEVLKGPASIAFGRGSTGGVVNQVSKAPQLDPVTAGTLTFGTDLTRRATGDFDQPFTTFGAPSAFRLDLMGTESDVAGRHVAENRRFGIAPSVAFGIGTSTRVTLSYYHQTQDDLPDYGIPWLLSRPAPVARENFYGFRENNFLKTDVDIGTVKLEHDFNDNLTLRNQLRYANYERDVQITEPQVPATVTAATPLDSIQVTRNQITARSTETSFDDQLDLTSKFDTWGINHTLVTGLEYSSETSDPTRTKFAGVPTTSLLSPDDNQPFTGIPTITSVVDATVNTFSAYAIDTLKLGEKWDLIGGLRWDRAESDYHQSVLPASSLSRVDNMVSWRGALVFKPVHNGSIYFDAGTSFNPSAENLSLADNTANLAPEKSLTFELGTKWDLFGERLSVTAAVFRDEKTNARTPDPDNPLLNILGGDQRVDGFEVGMVGKLTENWQVLTGYTFLDSEVVESNTPGQQGNPLVNTPRHTFSFWTTYELPWNLEIGAGADVVSSRNASLSPDLSTGLIKAVPGYVTFNAMAKYHLNKNIDIQVNLTNIGDKYYYDGIHPGHIVPGLGRTLLVSTSFKF